MTQHLDLGTITVDHDGSRTLRCERLVDHPPERLWAALTDPDELAAWLMEARLEPRVGGAVWFDFGDEGEAVGEVTVWDPPRALEYTWIWDGAAPSVVRWDLSADGHGTKLILTHAGVDLPGARDYGAGWHDFLDRLPAHLEGRDLSTWTSAYEDLLARYGQHT